MHLTSNHDSSNIRHARILARCKEFCGTEFDGKFQGKCTTDSFVFPLKQNYLKTKNLSPLNGVSSL